MKKPYWKQNLLIKALKDGKSLGECCKELNITKTQAREYIQQSSFKLPQKKKFVNVRQKDSVVLAIPDLHCPFHHPDALDFLIYVRDKFNPTHVVCLGDEIDAHSFSRYMPDPDGHGPAKELELAIEALTPFYREFPEVLVCVSNHTIRPWKKGFDSGLPQSFLRSVETVLNAPDGWVWSDRHEVNGVLYLHGDSGKSGAYAHQNYVKSFKQSVVIGHIHAHAGVQYDGNLFGMNAGCLIDKSAYAFKYAKNYCNDVNLGCGLVIGGEVGHFLPMRTDGNNRWIGRL